MVVTSPGTGDPSVGELSPQRTGVRRRFSGVIDADTAFLGPSAHWGTSTQRYLAADDIRFFQSDDEHGLLYVASTRIGSFSRPILLLPPALRDGMEWQVRGSTSDALGTFTAELRTESTLYGPDLPVWRVTQRNEVTGNAFHTDYVEGYGAVATESAELMRAVIPLTSSPPRATWPLSTLTPLNDGAPLLEDLAAKHVELVQPATGPATLRIGGETAYWDISGAIGTFSLAPSDACLELDQGQFSEAVITAYRGTHVPEPTCATALGGVLTEAGTYTQVVPVPSTGFPTMNSSTPFVAQDGTVQAILRLHDQHTDRGWLRGVPGAHTFATEGPHAGPIDLPWRPGAAGLGRVLTPLASTGDDDGIGFALQLDDVLLHGHSRGDRIDSTLRFAATIPGGRVGARLHPGGRDLIVTTIDGVVDALKVGVDGIELERIAVLDLPDGHELVGALPSDDGLLVFTLVGREDPVLFGDRPYLGALHAWTASITPVDNPRDLDSPNAPELGLRAWPTHDGVRVCWTQGRSEPSLDDWTLGGAPAHARRSGDDCIVVSGDIDPERVDAYRVEGPVPGVGRVVFAHEAPSTPEPPLWEHGSHPIAPIAGGFISYSLLYDAHMAPIGVPMLPRVRASELSRPGTVDLAGLGVWQLSQSSVRSASCPDPDVACRLLRHWGPDRQMDLVIAGGEILNAVAGGGVLLTGYNYGNLSQQALVLADGSFHPLPFTTEAATSTVQYYGGRSDGSACGIRSGPGNASSITCRDPDGTFHDLTLDDPLQVGRLGRAWAAAEGGFYVDAGPRIYFVDPEGPSLTETDLTPYDITNRLLEFTWSPSGELFAALYDRRQHGLLGLLYLANGDVTEVSVPEEMLDLQEHGSLLVGDQTFVLMPGSSGRRRVWHRD